MTCKLERVEFGGEHFKGLPDLLAACRAGEPKYGEVIRFPDLLELRLETPDVHIRPGSPWSPATRPNLDRAQQAGQPQQLERLFLRHGATQKQLSNAGNAVDRGQECQLGLPQAKIPQSGSRLPGNWNGVETAERGQDRLLRHRTPQARRKQRLQRRWGRSANAQCTATLDGY